MRFAQHYPLNLLVAESNPAHQEQIMTLLCHLGYTPTLAETRTQILDIVTERLFDVILLDLQIQGIDKTEIGNHLHPQPTPRIIALISQESEQILKALVKLGADDTLNKTALAEQIQITLCRWHHQLLESSSPPDQIKFAELLARVGHNPHTLKELIALFSTDGQRLLQQTEQALLTQNILLARKALHEFKGICSIFSTIRLKLLCKELEQVLHQTPPDQADSCLNATRLEFLKVQDRLQELLRVFEETTPQTLLSYSAYDI